MNAKHDSLVRRVGISVTFFTILLFSLVFSLDSVLNWWRGSCALQVAFRNVQGIRPSDPVHFHGVPCGRVAQISFEVGDSSPPLGGVALATAVDREDSDSGVLVVLDLEVPSTIFKHLRRGSEAHILKTLTGVTVVDIHQGEGAALREGERIQGVEPVTISEVTTTIGDAGDRLSTILVQVQQLTADLIEDDLIAETVRVLQSTVEEGRLLASELRKIADENRQHVAEIVEHAARLTKKLATTADALPDVVTELSSLAKRSGSLVAEVSAWFEENRGHLSAFSEDLASAADSVETLVADVRRRPWRLLHRPSKSELRSIDLYETGTAFARGARETRRSLDHLRNVLARSDDPDLRTRLNAALETLGQRATRLREFEEEFWRRFLEAK